jgi:hypothetical protein
MSANADVLHASVAIGSSTRETALPTTTVCDSGRWKPEDFAREQIRGLVRRVFFARTGRPVKHVVFTAAEPHTDLAGICDRVARTLAHETRAHVALLDLEQADANAIHTCIPKHPTTAEIKLWSSQIENNLWKVPKSGFAEYGEEFGTGLHWLPCLEKLRKEFEYAVIQAPDAGLSSEAELLAQLTDGIILVLGASSTRRATARKIKETLDGAQCRILGTVLTDRTFPIPERIYRRL